MLQWRLGVTKRDRKRNERMRGKIKWGNLDETPGKGVVI